MGHLFTGRFQELEQALVERVRELRAGRLLAPVTIVVGSSALAGRVQTVLAEAFGAYAGIRVVTLGRLARGLAAQQSAQDGRPLPHLLPWLARERLCRRLLAERAAAPGLAYFTPVADTPGLPAAFLRAIDDLRQAGAPITADLSAAIARRDKAADVVALYTAYCRALEVGGLADEAGMYESAARATGASGPGRAPLPAPAEQPELGAGTEAGGQITLPLEGFGVSPGGHPVEASGRETASAPGDAGREATPLILYGLADANAVQQRFLKALVAARPTDAFVPAPVASAAWSEPFVAGLRAAGLTPHPLIPALPAHAADVLTRRLFAGDLPTDAAGRESGPSWAPITADGSLGIVSAVNERAEAREAVRECLAAASRAVRFHEMAVVTPTAEQALMVAEAFAAAGVPVARLLPDRSRYTRSALRLLDAIAPLRGEPFERRALVEFLVTAELKGKPELAGEALWADEARRAGVVSGAAQWRERLGRHAGRLRAKLADLRKGETDEAEDGPFVSRCASLERRIAATAGLLAAAGRVIAAAERLPASGPWTELASALGTLMDELVVTPPEGGIDDELATLAALTAVEERVTLTEAVAALREALGRRRVAHGRVGRDGVALLTPLECRGLAFRLVVVAGLGEGGFPPRPRQDPVLLDGDRARIADQCGIALSQAGAAEGEAEFLFATVCEAARERLVLLFPRLDAATGRPRLPSRFLLRAVETVAGRRAALDGLDAALPPGLFRRAGRSPAAGSGSTAAIDAHELDVALLSGAAGDGLEQGHRSVARGYLAALLGGVAAERRRNQWASLRSPSIGPWDGLLADGAALDWLAAHDPFRDEVSPTAVERYVQCPFVFLLSYVLGLEVPEEPAAELEIEASTFGSLAHAILQGVYERVAAEESGREGALRALPQVAAEECARAERDGEVGAAAVWSARRRLLLEDLAHAVRIDPVFDGGRPLHLEWRFGARHERAVSLPLSPGQLRLRGRVDRIDKTADGSLVVIDYKTGSGSAEGKRLGNGRSVQLAAYLLAVRQQLQPHGHISCRYRLVTRKGGFADKELPDDETTTLQSLSALCSAVAAAAARGIFPRSPVNTWDCRHCDLRYACDLGSWAHSQKREAPQLQPLRRIQESSWREEVIEDGD